MKFVFLAIMAFSFSSFADEVLVKTCETSVSFDGSDKMDMTIQFVSNNEVLTAKVEQIISGNRNAFNILAKIEEDVVREGLTPTSEDNDLNLAERLVVHAMSLAQDPVFEGQFKLPFDLSLVRFAKVYSFSQEGEMGETAVVEAYDSKKVLLGSYLGGFLVGSCK